MATQPAAPAPGNGRESLNLSIGGRSIGIQAGNLTVILLIIGGTLMAYLLWISTDKRLNSLESQLAQVHQSLNSQTTTLLNAVHEQRSFVLQQVQSSRERLDMQTETIRKLLISHDWNMGREPSERFPLEIPPGPPEKQSR